jgi:Cu/Ag efflux pump CusA
MLRELSGKNLQYYIKLQIFLKKKFYQLGSLDRLNPILMTALSSALALIPLAINGDLAGNEIQSPMAKVILGGLLTSTFLNGFIVPIVYRFTAAKKKSNH